MHDRRGTRRRDGRRGQPAALSTAHEHIEPAAEFLQQQGQWPQAEQAEEGPASSGPQATGEPFAQSRQEEEQQRQQDEAIAGATESKAGPTEVAGERKPSLWGGRINPRPAMEATPNAPEPGTASKVKPPTPALPPPPFAGEAKPAPASSAPAAEQKPGVVRAIT